jgi:2-phospho-L-lactate guanylyltransferase (CobY/MobA/RfbA family)
LFKPNKNTAVLVFIRSEKEEATIKKFGSCLSFKGNCRVASLLNKRVKTIAKKSGLPTIIVGGNQQVGNDFGQRFTYAVAQIFEKGYENVIAIGNDCLSVSPQLLRQAATTLNHQKVVAGPTKDGGVYLLGFQKSVFLQNELATLPWQTNHLFSALKSYFQTLDVANFQLLRLATDADDAFSFQMILNQLSTGFAFKNILQNLLQATSQTQLFTVNFQTFLCLKTNVSRRGPPTELSISI